jgi:ankyrin repeat protein
MFLVGFQKIANLPMKRLRELEKETLQTFVGAWYFKDLGLEQGRKAEEELKYEQFLKWIGKHIQKTGEQLFKSSPSHISALGNMLIHTTAAESHESHIKGSDYFSFHEDQLILGKLQQHELLCHEILFRHRRLSFAHVNDCTHSDVKEEHEIIVGLCNKAMAKATQVLSSAPSSIRDVGRILGSLKWYLQRSVDSFLYYHFEVEIPPITSTSCMRDPLGRTAAHQWLDVVKPHHSNEFWLDDFKKMIHFEVQDLDERDFLGRTLLHIACQQRWYCGIAWLLEQGASPGTITRCRSLPLHYAAAQGSRPICELLLSKQYKSDIHAADNAGLSALDYATRFENTSVIELLSEYPIGGKDETAMKKARRDDQVAQESLHESPQNPSIGNLLDRVQEGITAENSSATFSEHSTESNIAVTVNISPASVTIKPTEVIEPLKVVIEHFLMKSLYCEMHDVQIVAAVVQKLRWHLGWTHESPASIDEQRSPVIRSLSILDKLEAELQHASSSLTHASSSKNAVNYPVLTAMHYAQRHIESLTFEPQELEMVARLARDAGQITRKRHSIRLV